MTIRPFRILRMINGLGQGGAEESLRKLTEVTKGSGSNALIVNLARGGALRPEFDRMGQTIVDLGMSRVPSPSKLWRLRQIAHEWNPDIIEGWMVHANVLASVLGYSLPQARVVWNVRADLSPSTERRLTRSLTRLGIPLSHNVDAIVYNSALAAEQYQAFGYTSRRARFIPNGFDTKAFVGGAARKQEARARFGLPMDSSIVGHVSRWHPEKNHRALLDAFSLVHKGRPDVILVMAGKDLDASNSSLTQELEARGLRDCTVALGSVRPSASLFPAFDAFALTSLREGFPNVLGEALASGVPCVSTDVGGCREVIGDSAVYPVGDTAGLAQGLLDILAQPADKRDRGADEGRRRVESLFSIEALGQRYLELYRELLATPLIRASKVR